MVNAFVSSRFNLVLPPINIDSQVLAFKGSETLDQPYFIHIQVVSENPCLDLEALLHQPAYLDFGETNGACTG